MQNTESLRLMQDLFASYEEGVKSITPIFSVAAMFLGADIERAAERNQLRETLARNGNLRKKDFDQMFSGLVEARSGGAPEIYGLLNAYISSQHETIRQLSRYFADVRKDMAGGDFQRIKLTMAQIKSVLARQEQDRQKLENELAEFGREREEINTGIKTLLQKGREVQVKDFKAMLARIKLRRRDRTEENKLRRATVSQMLAGFSHARNVTKRHRTSAE